MNADFRLLSDYCRLNKIDIRFNEPMSAHTSLRIGGVADALIIPKLRFLPDILGILKDGSIPYTVIGSGTNVLIMDGGVEGVVLLTEGFYAVEILPSESDSLYQEIYAEAGCRLKRIISLCVDSGLSGIEGLSGIPGSLGGAIAGNAGSFGFEIKDVLKSVHLLMPDLRQIEIDASEIDFGYRRAILPKDSIIVGAWLRLKRRDPVAVKKLVISYLRQKSMRQPISKRSAGCVFKNPSGVSAGKLIDEAGCKGMRIGDIEVSRMHGNFFINTGSASACDFLRLMDIVSKKVMDEFGIVLEPEIKILGRQ